jgi:hypothetical protein
MAAFVHEMGDPEFNGRLARFRWREQGQEKGAHGLGASGADKLQGRQPPPPTPSPPSPTPTCPPPTPHRAPRRPRLDLGTADEVALDVLINLMAGFSRDVAAIGRITVGGRELSGWAAPAAEGGARGGNTPPKVRDAQGWGGLAGCGCGGTHSSRSYSPPPTRCRHHPQTRRRPTPPPTPPPPTAPHSPPQVGINPMRLPEGLDDDMALLDELSAMEEDIDATHRRAGGGGGGSGGGASSVPAGAPGPLGSARGPSAAGWSRAAGSGGAGGGGDGAAAGGGAPVSSGRTRRRGGGGSGGSSNSGGDSSSSKSGGQAAGERAPPAAPPPRPEAAPRARPPPPPPPQQGMSFYSEEEFRRAFPSRGGGRSE